MRWHEKRSGAVDGRRSWCEEHERKFGPEYKAALRARNALFFVDLFRAGSRPAFSRAFRQSRRAHSDVRESDQRNSIQYDRTRQDFMSDLGNVECCAKICAAAEFVGAETNWSRDTAGGALSGIGPRRFSGSTTDSIFHGFLMLVIGFKHGTIRLLSVGRLVPFKGFDTLIDACAQLAEVDFHCEIIGEGPLREKLWDAPLITA